MEPRRPRRLSMAIAVVAAIAIGLTGFAAVASAALPRGTWVGQITQPGYGKFGLKLTLDSGRLEKGKKAATGRYSIPCRANFNYVGRGDQNRYFFRAIILSGNCVGGPVTLTPTQAGLYYRWKGDDATSYGRLHRP